MSAFVRVKPKGALAKFLGGVGEGMGTLRIRGARSLSRIEGRYLWGTRGWGYPSCEYEA